MLNLRVVGDTDDSVTSRMEPEPGTDWTTGCHVSIRTLRSLGRLFPALQGPLSKHGRLIPRSLAPLGPGTGLGPQACGRGDSCFLPVATQASVLTKKQAGAEGVSRIWFGDPPAPTKSTSFSAKRRSCKCMSFHKLPVALRLQNLSNNSTGWSLGTGMRIVSPQKSLENCSSG